MNIIIPSFAQIKEEVGKRINIVPKEYVFTTHRGTTTTTITSIRIVITNISLQKGANVKVYFLNDRGTTLRTKAFPMDEEVYNNWGEDDSVVETYILETLNLTKA